MDPFVKVFASEQEKRAYIEERMREFEGLDPIAKMTLGGADLFRANLESTCAIKVEPSTTPRPLTFTEKMTQQQEIDHIDLVTRGVLREDQNANLPAPLRDQAEREQQEWLEKLAGPARAAQSSFSAMVEDVVKKALAKAKAPLPQPQRPTITPFAKSAALASRSPIVPLAKAAVEWAEENEDDEMARLTAEILVGFATGDQAGMRKAVRAMAAA